MADSFRPEAFREIFESSPEKLLVLRADAPRFTIVAATDAYLRASGAQREAIEGRPLSEAFPGARALEAAIERKDGELLILEVASAEAALARGRTDAGFESGETLRVFIDSIKEYAVFMLDVQGNVRSWNPGAERIKGYRAGEIIGKHFSIFYLPEAIADGLPGRELEVAAANGRYEDEGWRLRKDGTRFWANVVISAMFDAGGRLIGFSKVTRDLTERRSAEAAKLRLLQAEEALRLRDEFLSIASHELKTPLTTLQLIASGILRGATRNSSVEPKLLARMQTLERQLQRLAALVNGLLDVSGMVAGQLRLNLEPVDLEPLVRELADRLHADLGKAGCELTVRCEGALVGNWDRLRLERTLSNLITNALKYGAGKPIAISAVRSGDLAILRVRDHGIGIHASEHARIFERFYRGVPVEHYGGFGLGLWIAKQFVEAMGGTIQVESVAGSGATFTVELPIAGPARSE